MTVSGLDRRLERLEAQLPRTNGISAATDDELMVALLDVARRITADPDQSQADRDAAAAQVALAETAIRQQAALHRDPAYAEHLAWVRGQRWPADAYVPALCSLDMNGAGSSFAEYADLDRPRVMERRAALRARPDIAALIAEGTAA